MVGRKSSMLLMAFCMTASKTHNRGRHSSSISLVDDEGKYLPHKHTQTRTLTTELRARPPLTAEEVTSLLTVCNFSPEPSKCAPMSCKRAETECVLAKLAAYNHSTTRRRSCAHFQTKTNHLPAGNQQHLILHRANKRITEHLSRKGTGPSV